MKLIQQFIHTFPVQELWFTLAVNYISCLTLLASVVQYIFFNLQFLRMLCQYCSNGNIKLHTPRGGSTQTGLALKYIVRKGFPGGRNSSTVAQIVILLSDGKSQGNAVQAAAQLKETGVVLFAVGLRYPRYV